MILYIRFLDAFGVTHTTRPFFESSRNALLICDRCSFVLFDIMEGVLGPSANWFRQSLRFRPCVNEISSHTSVDDPSWFLIIVTIW